MYDNNLLFIRCGLVMSKGAFLKNFICLVGWFGNSFDGPA